MSQDNSYSSQGQPLEPSIQIKNTRVHNLKNVDLSIQRNQFIVVTGLSGSGKSSLAFDTIYAEGQRRYVESLSSYARQFMGKIDKPAVDYIKGIPPAIAIEQHVNKRNPRSTVGTSTEIYDFLKLLFARIGKTYSPVSQKEVKKHDVNDVVHTLLALPAGTKTLILAPMHHIPHEAEKKNEFLESLVKEGITRIEHNNTIIDLNKHLQNPEEEELSGAVNSIIDRIKVKHDDSNFTSRISDSIEIAFKEGHGECLIKTIQEDQWETYHFSNRYEADGMEFEEPSVNMFSFNNPLGACPVCEGYGSIIGIDEDKVVPNKQRSVYEDAIVCWKGEKMQRWKDQVVYNAEKCNFPVHKPYEQLTDNQKQTLWEGCKHFKGINQFFEYLERKKYKIQYRVMLSRYRGRTTCPECKGTRLKKESSRVKINDKNIQELVELPIDELYNFFQNLSLPAYQANISERLLEEIRSRLYFLMNVGLNYLTLNRTSATLSGGESQRINLATSLGSSLVGSLYILDEPSIGLHPRDNHLLIEVLKQLKDLGNTVMVVEHDEDIIRSADEIIDLGPLAGHSGGEIMHQGSFESLLKNEKSLTSAYLTGQRNISIPQKRRKWNNYITINGAHEHNLKHIDVRFPLNIFTVITGVSGSGKSSLLSDILYPALKQKLGEGSSKKPGNHTSLTGDYHLISDIEYMDQNPIGKTSRSNPVTYIKAYDDIRKLFAMQQLAVQKNLNAKHFSFNTAGGRCDECEGEGVIKIEMQFMADVYLTCENCGGKRFKDDILEVQYKGKSIADVLDLTVDEALDFFQQASSFDQIENRIVQKLKVLQEVGLEYVTLGQSATSLSGGESQRIKLASFLSKKEQLKPLLFIFDEPTTGLHFHDINKLLAAFNALIAQGHTVMVIEHQMDVIKTADWIIDLGPEGGKAGGYLVAEGTPENLLNCEQSHTASYLKEKLTHA